MVTCRSGDQLDQANLRPSALLNMFLAWSVAVLAACWLRPAAGWFRPPPKAACARAEPIALIGSLDCCVPVCPPVCAPYAVPCAADNLSQPSILFVVSMFLCMFVLDKLLLH